MSVLKSTFRRDYLGDAPLIRCDTKNIAKRFNASHRYEPTSQRNHSHPLTHNNPVVITDSGNTDNYNGLDEIQLEIESLEKSIWDRIHCLSSMKHLWISSYDIIDIRKWVIVHIEWSWWYCSRPATWAHDVARAPAMNARTMTRRQSSLGIIPWTQWIGRWMTSTSSLVVSLLNCRVYKSDLL